MKVRSNPSAISVRNLQRKVSIDVVSLQRFARQALAVCLGQPRRRTRLRKLKEVSVLLISDRRMADLHERFLHEAGPTDVITFEHGEIFVSVETARKNARLFTNSLMQEIQLYIVHGLLHLDGFDDRRSADAK